ncbi:MAG TPA: GNAT family N-acetyltransferase [Limnochordia bacterium]|jgi:GNAT superfamily N-acetyltransferase|nr:GNAT family N-acetyltransferase [Limnochordia bacterium]
MSVTIKPLTKDLIPAYLDFFDHRAFSDNNPNGPCYCTSPSMTAASIQKMVSEFGDDVKGTIRRYAERLLEEGKIHGYLAFNGDTPIGWCNAGDLADYVNVGFDAEMSEFIHENACGKTMSVVCFAIAPEYRGKGIATALLQRAIFDARENGYAVVEGYATVLDEPVYYDYTGPIALFEKMGFYEVARHQDRVILRKDVRHEDQED